MQGQGCLRDGALWLKAHPVLPAEKKPVWWHLQFPLGSLTRSCAPGHPMRKSQVSMASDLGSAPLSTGPIPQIPFQLPLPCQTLELGCVLAHMPFVWYKAPLCILTCFMPGAPLASQSWWGFGVITKQAKSILNTHIP